MAEITKMLGIAINDYDAGRLSPEQLIAIVQEAIDNGDVLLPDNEFYAAAVVNPMIDSGVLKPVGHTEALESRMNKKAAEMAAKLRTEKLPGTAAE